MVKSVREKWDGRYTLNGDHWQRNQPRELLLTYLDRLPPTGLALDAAAGVGTNGLVLARRGLHVLALDISEAGLRLARKQAMKEGLRLETAVYDLSRPWFPANCFDVILNFRFLERATFPAYRHALKPGGWLVFETFIRCGDEVEEPDYYLEIGELHHAFRDFDVLHSSESVITGIRSGQIKKVAQLVAGKPSG